MKRTVAAVVILLVCTGCAAEPAAAPPALDATTVSVGPSTTLAPSGSVSVAESDEPGTTVPACDLGDALDAVWMVETSDGHGSGFHIGDGDWISAAHVVGDVDTVLLRHGSDEIEAVVVGIDHTTDVAVLNAPAPISASLMLSADVPEVGSDTIAAGFPLYGEPEPSVTRGVLSRFERDTLLGELVLTDTAVNPGNSGGPLLDACGAVVGMIVQKIVDASVEGIGYAVTAGELNSQLPRLRSGYRIAATPATVPATTGPVGGDHSAWTLFWTEPDLMTGETFPIAVTTAVDWEMDSLAYDPPLLWVGCSKSWNIWWGGKYLYAPPVSTDMAHLGELITVELRIDDYEFWPHSWTLIDDETIQIDGRLYDEFLPEGKLALGDMLVIRAWNGYFQDQEQVGTAAFALDGYVQALSDLADACLDA